MLLFEKYERSINEIPTITAVGVIFRIKEKTKIVCAIIDGQSVFFFFFFFTPISSDTPQPSATGTTTIIINQLRNSGVGTAAARLNYTETEAEAAERCDGGGDTWTNKPRRDVLILHDICFIFWYRHTSPLPLSVVLIMHAKRLYRRKDFGIVAHVFVRNRQQYVLGT